MSSTVPEATKLAPDTVISQLRTMRSQIGEVAPLTQAERNLIKQRLRTQPKVVVEASINVIGVVENVSQAIGQQIEDVRQLQDESLRWEAAAEEARAFLKGLEGSNLKRRQRIMLLATQAYSIGTQLARDPENAVLVPHLEEIKRLKGVARRKTKTPASQTPAPQVPAPAPTHDPSTPSHA